MGVILEQLTKNCRFTNPVVVERFDEGEKQRFEFDATFILPDTDTRIHLEKVDGGELSLKEAVDIMDRHLVDWHGIIHEDETPVPCEGEYRKQAINDWPTCFALIVSLLQGSKDNGAPARKNSETPPDS